MEAAASTTQRIKTIESLSKCLACELSYLITFRLLYRTTVSIIEKRATKIRFLTCALPEEFKDVAKDLLEFRNSASPENLLFPDNLLSNNRVYNVFSRTEPIIMTRFQTPVTVNLVGGSDLFWREISSIDQLVKLRVPFHLQTFEVIFPCRIMEADPTDKSRLLFTMITQTHPTYDPPKNWIYPLLCALKTINSANEITCSQSDLESLMDRLSSLAISYSLLESSSKFPDRFENYDLNTVKAHEFDLMPIVVLTNSHMTVRLPVFNEAEYLPSHSRNAAFRGHLNPTSFSKTEEIKVVECDYGCFRAIILNPATVEIQITLTDGSIILTTADFKFLRMWLHGSWIEEMYLVEMATELGTFTNYHTGAIYPMREIVTIALSLYQNVHSNMKNDDYQIETSNPTFSSTVKRSMSVPNIGDFKYYADGRCKCTFYDRTIIEFSSKDIYNGLASVLDQSGSNLRIRISNPVGYEEHIKAMLEFIEFVTNPQGERAELEVKKQKILNELLAQRSKSLEHSQKLDTFLKNW